MNYSLIRLRFTTAVHFGLSDSALSLYASADGFCADTLFSALCQTASSLYGDAAINDLCKQAKQGELLISDSMPWREDMQFLPKPMITAESHKEIPSQLRKDMKRLKWIPVETFPLFVDSLHSDSVYDASKYLLPFGRVTEVSKAHCQPGQNATPYQVGVYHFMNNCGLSVIIGCKTDSQMQQIVKLITALGVSGIGGKTSAGYGRFTIENAIPLHDSDNKQASWLYRSLSNETANHSLLLTSSLPKESELEQALHNAYFQLVRRGGFLYPDRHSPAALKKKTQYYLGAGAVLTNRFAGDLYEVCPDASHPVYRYSKPMFLGVEL